MKAILLVLALILAVWYIVSIAAAIVTPTSAFWSASLIGAFALSVVFGLLAGVYLLRNVREEPPGV
jgi:hypothetical protein